MKLSDFETFPMNCRERERRLWLACVLGQICSTLVYNEIKL